MKTLTASILKDKVVRLQKKNSFEQFQTTLDYTELYQTTATFTWIEKRGENFTLCRMEFQSTPTEIEQEYDFFLLLVQFGVVLSSFEQLFLLQSNNLNVREEFSLTKLRKSISFVNPSVYNHDVVL